MPPSPRAFLIATRFFLVCRNYTVVTMDSTPLTGTLTANGAFCNKCPIMLIAVQMNWSRLIGQFGGLFKLFPGCIYAASLWLSIAGASPGNAEISVS